MPADIAKIKELRDHIASLPNGAFDYASFWSNAEHAKVWALEGVAPECGTAGCIAGHTISYFQIKGTSHQFNSPGSAAAEFLGLSEANLVSLFYAGTQRANKADALARLDHLIEHGDLKYYNYRNESWWNLPVTPLVEQHPDQPIPPASTSPETSLQTTPVPAPRRHKSNTTPNDVHVTHPVRAPRAGSLVT